MSWRVISVIELIMGRPLGSKNKRKTLSHCLTAQDKQVQDGDHLYRENRNFLDDAESDSENESEYDDSELEKNYEISVYQCESQDRPITITQASKSLKKTQLDKGES
jgi:hypothetical protein